ncbi:MAG: NfeD family protein [Planctomycetota bacterium]
MEVALPIILVLIGFALLVLEVFVPSMGLLTVASLGFLVGAMVMGFRQSSDFGFALLGVAAVGVPVVLIVSFKVFPKTPLGKHMILSGPGRHPKPATRAESRDLVGKEGVSLSSLRPSGIAEIAGRRIDVVTRGELVEPGVRIEVIESRGNRFVVRSVEEPAVEEEEELR